MARSAPFDLESSSDSRESVRGSQGIDEEGRTSPENPGDLVNDRYELVSRIGVSSAGTVWEAIDLLTRERIALHRPAPHLAADTDWVFQYLREAVAAMRFSSASPRFVTTFHVDQDDRGPFLLMERAPEPTLRHWLDAWLASERPTPDQVAALIGEIAVALSELHAGGFVHGEFNPEDIAVSESVDGFRVRLSGFSLAENAVVLAPGSVFSSPAGRYASPEHMDGRPVGPASDVFSLGVLAYECFTGFIPRGVFDPLADCVDGIKAAWSETVQSCLAFRPERRPSMASVIEAFSNQSRALVVLTEPEQTEGDATLENGVQPDEGTSPEPSPEPTNHRVFAPSTRFAIASERAAGAGLPQLAAYLEWMRSVPGGTFPLVDDRRPSAGGRIYEVVVSPYVMGRHSVTVGMWREYCAAAGLDMPDAPEWGWIDDHPMVNVSWEDVAGRGGKGGYCGWASRQSGMNLTLPTLAQREFASRDCGQSLEWPWGLTFQENSLWGSVNVARDRTAPVFRSEHIFENSVGLVDMAGNVWDWCSDWFSPYESRPVPPRKRFFGGRDEVVLTDPKGTARGDFKGMAGGSWSDYSPILFRCHGRIWDLPQYRSSSVGFRLVSPDA